MSALAGGRYDSIYYLDSHSSPARQTGTITCDTLPGKLNSIAKSVSHQEKSRWLR